MQSLVVTLCERESNCIAAKGRSVKAVEWIWVFSNLFSVGLAHLRLSAIEAKTAVKTISMLKLPTLQPPPRPLSPPTHHHHLLIFVFPSSTLAEQTCTIERPGETVQILRKVHVDPEFTKKKKYIYKFLTSCLKWYKKRRLPAEAEPSPGRGLLPLYHGRVHWVDVFRKTGVKDFPLSTGWRVRLLSYLLV